MNKGRIISALGQLVSRSHFSEIYEDWHFPKTMPKWYARRLVKTANEQREFINDMIYEIRRALKEESTACNIAMVPCSQCFPHNKCPQNFPVTCSSVPCMLSRHQ